MSLETTRCPRCESTSVVRLPESIGFNQWCCNQCTHQWDVASREERAVVPKHLTGGKIEQFLEEYLAIKAVIKGEAEKIWNGCANAAHQAIGIAGNEDKRHVFAEQVDRWRDQLIGLQETLIIDRLLPLVAKYQISSNEQTWLFQACHEAWGPVTAGYIDWFTFAMHGQLYGAEPWAIPEWAWQLGGAPRPVAHLDVNPDEKASSLLHCLGGTLERDLVGHRKGAIAKAFLARKPSDDLTEEMRKQSTKADAEIAFETAPMCDAQPYSKVLANIRERFLRDTAILRIENGEGVCDRLTHNSDQNGAFKHPYKLARAGFTEWIENLGKFAAGHVMTLARMASAHSEWGIADPAEWARIQVAEFVDDELYPKRCRKCGKPRSEHSGTDHEFNKAMSRIELWWRIVSDEEEDFDRYEYGRPEHWSAPAWIQKNPERTENFLRARHFDFDERLKWALHDAEGDARIEQCLASVNSGSVAASAPGALKANAARDDLNAGLIRNLKTAPEIVPVSTTERAIGPLSAALEGKLVGAREQAKPANEARSAEKAEPSPEIPLTDQPGTQVNVDRALLVEKIRREIREIADAIELPEDYDTRIRTNEAFARYATVVVCNRHPDLREKLCAIKTTKKPRIVDIACEIAVRSGATRTREPISANTFKDAYKRYGSKARSRLDQRQ